VRENEISLRKWSGGAAQLRTSERALVTTDGVSSTSKTLWLQKLYDFKNFMTSKTLWLQKLYDFKNFMTSKTLWLQKLHDFKNFMTSKSSWLQKHYVVLTVVFSLLRLKVFVNNEERGKCHWSILVPIFLVPFLLMYLTYNNQSTCLSCIQTFHFDFFYVSGKKNYLPPSYLVYGFGFLFKVGSAEFNVSTGDWIICEICIKQKLLYIMRLCFCGSLVTAFLNLFFMYQFTIASLQYNVMSD